jgi:5-methylcytosine-specific restriction endonuclease McrA
MPKMLSKEDIKQRKRVYDISRRPRKNELQKKRRHELGISKTYREGKYSTSKIYKNKKEYWKASRQKRKAFKKGGGILTTKTLQSVYEENIKKYGTLTCYLCLKPIEFGKDHLEHKTPLSRGGTNQRDNLDIACQSCNCRKHCKTEEEYRKDIV